VHTGSFEPRADSHLASGLDNPGGSTQALGMELRIAHAVAVGLEIVETATSVFGVGDLAPNSGEEDPEFSGVEFVNESLANTGITVDFEFQQSIWLEAGRRFALYAKRRRRSAHQGPKRLLADFIIGSHALAKADRFMTLDPKRYERDFPELRFI